MRPEWCHTPPSCGGRLGPSFILLTKHSGSLAPADHRRSPTRCQATQHPDAELTESQRKMANAPILAMWVTSLREWLSVPALGTTWTTQMAIPVSQGLTSCACCLPLCHRSKTGRDLILPSFCLLPLDVVSPCALPASSFSLKLHDPSQLPLGPDSSVLRLRALPLPPTSFRPTDVTATWVTYLGSFLPLPAFRACRARGTLEKQWKTKT